MKQIVLCLIGILFASFVSAQKINHPSLLYTPQRIQQVKQRMQNEPKLREAWEDIQKTADEALQKEDVNRLDNQRNSFESCGSRILGRYGNDGTYSSLAFATGHGT
mgnify:CR=1 FL=1